MTRKQLIATGSVIAVIIVFTLGVKIIASNTTPPEIALPPGAFDAPATGTPIDVARAPPVILTPPAPVGPAVAETTGPPPAPAPAPVGVVSAGPAAVQADSGIGGRRLTNMGIPSAPVIGVVAGPETPVSPAPSPEEPAATPETDRHEALELQRREQRNAAVTALIAVQQQLGSGDTSGVDQALAAAAASMNALGQSALEQARTAIANKDLTRAALLISQAVATSSATPPVQPSLP